MFLYLEDLKENTSHRLGENVSTDISDTGLISNICKELLSSKIREQKQNKNRKHLFKEIIQIIGKHLKKCSTSNAIREMQMKTTMRYQQTLLN
jgi:hypothetical protein